MLGALLLLFVALGVPLQRTSAAATIRQQDSTTFPFVDVTAQAGITGTHEARWDEKGGEGYLAVGQAWGDYDDDGWPDLYVTGNLAANVLYHNNRDGTFSVSAHSPDVSLPQVVSGGAVWADYDNDGRDDLYVLADGANVLFHNDGATGFTNVTERAGVGSTGKGTTATWGDYNEDSYLDLYVVNWSCAPECDPVDFGRHQDHLYRNNGDGTFTDVSQLLVYEKLLGAGFTASFTDYDNDGDLDIYVVNDRIHNPIGNVLWRNDGPGCEQWCWTDASAESGADVALHGMGLAVGDYDNDLNLDFYFSNMTNAFPLLHNQGDGTFSDHAREAGVDIGWSDTVGWGTSFFDYDNDGWQDIYVAATGFIQRDLNLPPEGMLFPHADYLFHNNRDRTFHNTWQGKPRPSMGVAYADYDNNGWLDLLVSNWNEGFALFRNQGTAGSGNNWLKVSLEGGGPVNRSAVGARVYVTTDEGATKVGEVRCGSSLGAGEDMRPHFGLGDEQIKTVKVVWPDGVVEEFTDVPSNQVWHVHYGASAVQPTGLLLTPWTVAVAGLFLAFTTMVAFVGGVIVGQKDVGALQRKLNPFAFSLPRWLTRIVNPRHVLALALYLVVVVGHASEHVVQVVQAFVLDWPRPEALGLLGFYYPQLVTSEVLHFSYNLIQLAGLLLLAKGFHGRARRWWKGAMIAQTWHFFEHLLLQVQWLTGHFLFGASKQISIGELLLPRIELHFIYVLLVTIPTLLAVYHYVRQNMTKILNQWAISW